MKSRRRSPRNPFREANCRSRRFTYDGEEWLGGVATAEMKASRCRADVRHRTRTDQTVNAFQKQNQAL